MSRDSSLAMIAPAFTRVPSATPIHSRRPDALDEIAALRCATTYPVELSTTNCCDGYVVTMGVVWTVTARGCNANHAPPAIRTIAPATNQIHLRRRRVCTGASERSILSLDRSSADTAERYNAIGKRRIISCSLGRAGGEAREKRKDLTCPGDRAARSARATRLRWQELPPLRVRRAGWRAMRASTRSRARRRSRRC